MDFAAEQDTTEAQHTDTAAQYAHADRRLTAVLDVVPAQDWSAASPCEGWSARDVLTHLVDTQRDFFTGHGVDLGGPPEVDTDPARAWRAHADRVMAALSDDAVAAKGLEGYFGPTTVGATFGQFYVWDMLVHRWDIARAAGGTASFSDAELDRIADGADSFGDALHMDGICRGGVDAPAGAEREARLLARLGRVAA